MDSLHHLICGNRVYILYRCQSNSLEKTKTNYSKYKKMKKAYFVVLFLLFVPLTAFADDDRGRGDVQNLGWLAIGTGAIAMVPIFAAQKIKKYVIKVGGGVSSTEATATYKSILNLHIILNSIAFFAGMAHGFLLVRHLDSISLSLAITMTVMMISGILLKYTQFRNVNLFNRLLHGQTGLVILLMVLIFLHVITRM
jgi:hypothetical protein